MSKNPVLSQSYHRSAGSRCKPRSLGFSKRLLTGGGLGAKLSILAMTLSAALMMDAGAVDLPGHRRLADQNILFQGLYDFFSLEPPIGVTAAGEAIFYGNYSTSGIGLGFPSGLWGSTGGMHRSLVLKGMAAPGGGVYDSFNTFADHHTFTTTGFGAFVADYEVTPNGVENIALFLATPSGPVVRFIAEGQSAPGGGTFASLDFQCQWSLANSGKVAFYAPTDGGAGGGYFFGQLSSDIPVIQKVAVQGDAAPGGDGTFTQLSNRWNSDVRVAVNDDGMVTFRSNSTAGSHGTLYQWNGTTVVKIANSERTEFFMMNNAGQVVTVSETERLLLGTAATGLQAIVSPGDVLPDGGSYTSIWGKPLLNESGQVVFVVFGKGIYLWSAGVLKALALSGQAAPGGGTFGDLGMAEPMLTNSGLVVFRASTSGGDRIIMTDGNEMVSVVAKGDQIDGQYVDSLRLAIFYNSTPYIAGQGPCNDAGQIGYWARLKPTPSASASNDAVFLFTPPSRWWSGGSGGWEPDAHWQFGFVPSAVRDVIIDPSSSATITGPAANAAVRTLQVGGGGGITRLELSPGATLSTSSGTTVLPNGVLAGAGTLTGNLFMDGIQEVRSDAPAQSLGSVTYTNRSHLSFYLVQNSAAITGTAAQSMTVSAGAQIDLSLAAPGSTVDFTASFWQQKHAWKLLTATALNGAFVLGQGSNPATLLDSAGHPATAFGVFTLRHNASTSPKSVELVWTPVQQPPQIMTPPASQLVGVNSPFSFEVAATGNALEYQWLKNNANIPSANASIYGVGSATLASAGNYKVRVSNDRGAQVSAEAGLGVVDRAPKVVALVEGNTLTLAVSAMAPPGRTFSYQWRKGIDDITNSGTVPNRVISGATAATLSIMKTTSADSGDYSCRISLAGAAAPLDSSVFSVSVSLETVPPSAPTIASPVANSTHSLNTSATLPLTGSASDNKGVASVRVKLNDGGYSNATLATPGSPTSSFSLDLVPVAGSNTITVEAVDTNGNISPPVTRTFKVLRPLLVNVASESGSVTAGFAPQASYREVGKSFTVAATAKTPTTTPASAGTLFTGWTINWAANTPMPPAVPTTQAESAARIGVPLNSLEKNSLTFIFREGLELTANFVTNPYTAAIAGTYNGLIKPSPNLPVRPGAEPDGTTPSNSSEGHLTATVQNSGAFSGKLSIDGFVLNFSGNFDHQGRARFGTARAFTQTVARTGKPSLSLRLDIGGPAGSSAPAGKIIGELSATEFQRSVVAAVSLIDADRAYFTGLTADLTVPDDYLTVTGSAPRPTGRSDGSFTVVMSSIVAGSQPLRIRDAGYTTGDYPQGDGVGTLKISKAGLMTFTGTLADGTAVTAVGSLSQDLRVALFAPLYSSKGFFSAHLKLNSLDADSDVKAVAGTEVLWARPFIGTSHHYPYGWPEVLSVGWMGARYVAITGQSAMKAPDGADQDLLGDALPSADADGNVRLTFSDGLLTQSLFKAANLSIADVVAKVPDNDPTFTLTVNRSTGAVTGTFTHTEDTVPSFNAILYQKGSGAGAYGYFLTKQPLVIDLTGESGGVTLLSQP